MNQGRVYAPSSILRRANKGRGVREGWVGWVCDSKYHTQRAALSLSMCVCITPWAQWHARMQSGERAGARECAQ
jgi:hypothetical protein